MRYLGLALFAEGFTDHRFLRPLLRRVTERACLASRFSVELGEVLELHSPVPAGELNRAERILQAALEAAGVWHLLFLHSDGAGDPAAARSERIDPAVARLRTQLPESDRGFVAVVPVRETEAWVLADPTAVRVAFGRAEGDDLGLPEPPAKVEDLLEPKKALREAYFGIERRGRASRRRISSFFEVLGETVSLERLDGVPAFSSFDRDLRQQLASLRVLGGGRSG